MTQESINEVKGKSLDAVPKEKWTSYSKKNQCTSKANRSAIEPMNFKNIPIKCVSGFTETTANNLIYKLLSVKTLSSPNLPKTDMFSNKNIIKENTVLQKYFLKKQNERVKELNEINSDSKSPSEKHQQDLRINSIACTTNIINNAKSKSDSTALTEPNSNTTKICKLIKLKTFTISKPTKGNNCDELTPKQSNRTNNINVNYNTKILNPNISPRRSIQNNRNENLKEESKLLNKSLTNGRCLQKSPSKHLSIGLNLQTKALVPSPLKLQCGLMNVLKLAEFEPFNEDDNIKFRSNNNNNVNEPDDIQEKQQQNPDPLLENADQPNDCQLSFSVSNQVNKRTCKDIELKNNKSSKDNSADLMGVMQMVLERYKEYLLLPVNELHGEEVKNAMRFNYTEDALAMVCNRDLYVWQLIDEIRY